MYHKSESQIRDGYIPDTGRPFSEGVALELKRMMQEMIRDGILILKDSNNHNSV